VTDPGDQDADGWDRAAATFLGGGYRVLLPRLPAAIGFARDQARQVTDRLGIAWDEAPWDALPAGDAVEVSGGAAYDPRTRAYGELRTRAVPVPLPAPPDAPVAATDLPWTWPSDGPLAGLPTLTGLAEDVAARHLEADGAVVGLWWNHRDELCTSTSGPLLLRLDDGWVRPPDGAGAVPSWAFVRAAEQVGARPGTITREVLARARDVAAVSPLGVWSALLV
jgi:branched-subunit amino acid aminotransferase/4-amino-4-deoxychorismate lyase